MAARDKNLIGIYLAKSKIEKPFFLSGGIGLDDVEKIRAFKHPDFYAVDLNSKFEKSPGVKDMALVIEIYSTIKCAKSETNESKLG